MMKRRSLLPCALFAFSLSALLSPATSAGAQVSAVPAAINFQGRLAKPDGTPVADGTYNIQFSVYSATTGGTLLWQRSITGIASNTITHSELASDPASLTDVSGGYIDIGDNEYLDAFSQSNTSLTSTYAWQSFTAETDGYLRSIGIYCGTNGGASVNVTFSLYSGEGTGGSVLASQTVSVTGPNGLKYFSLPTPLLISKGTKYTWYLGNNSALKIGYGTGNPYTGGTADFGTGNDYNFANYMSLNPMYSRL